jgi:hypothetical protein
MIPKDPYIYNPRHFASSGFEDSDRLTSFLSWSGQRQIDHDVYPTVRGDPKYPHVYGSHYLVTEK